MSERNLKHSVAGYFKEQSLPDNRVARLSALANAVSPDAQAKSSGSRWLLFTGALLVCVIATSFLTAYFVSRSGDVTDGLMGTDLAGHPSTESTGQIADEHRMPRLVAVSTRADWCPMCPQMATCYKELMEEYGKRRVLFVVFDVTDEAARKQTEYLATTLGIEWLCNPRMPTGTIKLIDRAKRAVLASATRPDQVNKLICSLNESLPGGPGT